MRFNTSLCMYIYIYIYALFSSIRYIRTYIYRIYVYPKLGMQNIFARKSFHRFQNLKYNALYICMYVNFSNYADFSNYSVDEKTII